jgi:hypothetical protein
MSEADAKAVNQCMGCQAGWPIIKPPHGRDIHEVVGGYPSELMVCTDYIYGTNSPKNDAIAQETKP